MSDKVRGGTPKTTVSACLNCRNAQVVRGMNLQEVIYCRAAGGNQPVRVGFPVTECSVFDDKRVPALYQMEEIAWTVQSRNRGPIGFNNGGGMEITLQPPNQNPPTQQPAQWPQSAAGAHTREEGR